MQKFTKEICSLAFMCTLVGAISSSVLPARADAVAFSMIGENWRIDVPVSNTLNIDVAAASAGSFGVAIALDRNSASALCKHSKASAGKTIAIVVGCRIVSKPVIISPICGGHLQISGNFFRNDAEKLANEIRTGAPYCAKPAS